MVDLYLHVNGEPSLTWRTGAILEVDGGTRYCYIVALQAADRGDIEPLLGLAAG